MLLEALAIVAAAAAGALHLAPTATHHAAMTTLEIANILAQAQAPCAFTVPRPPAAALGVVGACACALVGLLVGTWAYGLFRTRATPARPRSVPMLE